MKAKKPLRKPPAAKPKDPGRLERIRFDQGKEVRAIARERVGPVKPAQVVPDAKDKKLLRKPKHKPPAGAIPESET